MGTLLRSSPPSFAFPSRWSRPAFPSHCPSSRSLSSLSASLTHLLWLAPWRSVLCLASLSSRRSPSSQLSSARLNLSQLPASLRCPPSPSKLLNGTDNNHQNSEIGTQNSKLNLLELEIARLMIWKYNWYELK